MIRSDGGLGTPSALSKARRSLAIVGEPKGSTMTMVAPLPVIPREYRAFRPYACWS